ncbi:transglycosylase SLT domain-containing protein [Lysobacter sp. S4-A87]|uniref:lytic transglycosylase domain-containing protein n=1 Tax=Lysobacter sp. S4-A87 TaxID=2925843 RepID=UPI001F535FFB|nr:lytic transglycosylase domain-containing protein [Lysobacter sp. S4-A87]UNK51103.1 transglycosylase SLT domain-containing protein [Lysobacter sp. S4-A87]
MAAGLLLGGAIALPATAQDNPANPTTPAPAPASTPAAVAGPADPATRNGREIYEDFRRGLAEPECEAGGVSKRWRQHFATAPKRLAADDDLLPLFGYVVDALRQAHLPTEFALIPFVESGYRPGARSPAGPAGLWQMIAITARNHDVPMRKGYDGRLSPVDSTTAAVRYLKTLHGMFAGDWRLTVMAYNAGEYRVLGALKRSGQTARDARPEQLQGLSDITQAYVRKLHALSCLMEQADDREEWLRSLDRPVPRLQAVTLPADVKRIDQWATRTGQDSDQLKRLNPVHADGIASRPARILATPAPAPASLDPAAAVAASAAPTTDGAPVAAAEPSRKHKVRRGENASTIAKRYDVRVADLMQRNGLATNAVLKPGQMLVIDPLGGQGNRVPSEAGSP